MPGNTNVLKKNNTTLSLVGKPTPTLTLRNTEVENGEGECESKIIFKNNALIATSQIEGSHHGTSDDDKGKLILSTNNDSSLQTALTIDSAQLSTFAGNVTLNIKSLRT